MITEKRLQLLDKLNKSIFLKYYCLSLYLILDKSILFEMIEVYPLFMTWGEVDECNSKEIGSRLVL